MRNGPVGGPFGARHHRRGQPPRRQAVSARGLLSAARAPTRSARDLLIGLTGLIVLTVAAGSAAAQTPAPSCHAPQHRKEVAQLLFGRDVGGRLGASEADWTRFGARESTPRFPDGFTVVDDSGQWRDAQSGEVVREPSKLVEIAL